MTRIHVVSLPHTLLTKSYDWCAYTAKTRRFARMLGAAEIDCLLYGPDYAEIDETVTDYVPVVDTDDRINWFGAPEWDINRVFDRWDENDPCWVTMNHRAALAIRERWQPGDMLGLIGGRCQQLIMTQLADLNPLTVEWGIGYSGVLDGTHKVFESYAWMHHVAGYYHRDDIAFFDSVIPNCFDLEDFTPSFTTGDYLLYLGRPNPRKGLPIVADIAKRAGVPVYIAGQPGEPIPHTEYVGVVTGAEKAALLAGARALLAPTTYLEPFGGVAVEAMLSGTPAITTDYGAFTETVAQGVSGYRCRMLVDFLEAVEAAETINRQRVFDYAKARYTTGVGAHLYGEYLSRVESLYGRGWYAGTREPEGQLLPA